MAKERGAADGGHGGRDLRRPDGPDDELLRHAGGVPTGQRELEIVAGSMRDAFGVKTVKHNGIVEQDGRPTRLTTKNVARSSRRTPRRRRPDGSRAPARRPEGEAGPQLRARGREAARGDAGNAGELRAVEDIMIEETDVGRTSRSSTRVAADVPTVRGSVERTRRVIGKLAVPLKVLPNRVSITGPRRRAAAAAPRLRSVGALRRSRQRGAPDPRGRGAAERAQLPIAGKA